MVNTYFCMTFSRCCRSLFSRGKAISVEPLSSDRSVKIVGIFV